MRLELPNGTSVTYAEVAPADPIRAAGPLEFPKPWAVAMPHPHENTPDCWCEPELVPDSPGYVRIRHRRTDQ